eukprot:scaffold10708_cov130-Amphora_coffeaeformis.AAC.2
MVTPPSYQQQGCLQQQQQQQQQMVSSFPQELHPSLRPVDAFDCGEETPPPPAVTPPQQYYEYNSNNSDNAYYQQQQQFEDAFEPLPADELATMMMGPFDYQSHYTPSVPPPPPPGLASVASQLTQRELETFVAAFR